MMIFQMTRPKVFLTVMTTDQTRDRYYRQDVIRNPWFWIVYESTFIIIAMGIHTIAQVNNKAYTNGYQDWLCGCRKRH